MTTLRTVSLSAFQLLWASSKNASDVQRILYDICDVLGHHAPIHTVNTPAAIQQLKQAWAGVSGARRNRKLSTFRQLLIYACDAGIVDTVTRFPRKERESAGRERFLTQAEAQAILASVDREDYRRFLTFLLFTGARCGEALALRPADISADSVTFRSSSTKSGKSRTVPLTTEAYSAINGLDLSNIKHSGLFRAFKTAVLLAGVDNPDEVCIHTFRHTCASWLVDRGIDIRRVQLWMGHSSVSTTERYAKLANSLETLSAAKTALASFAGAGVCEPVKTPTDREKKDIDVPRTGCKPHYGLKTTLNISYGKPFKISTL